MTHKELLDRVSRLHTLRNFDEVGNLVDLHVEREDRNLERKRDVRETAERLTERWAPLLRRLADS
jgi:hypothetical protein